MSVIGNNIAGQRLLSRSKASPPVLGTNANKAEAAPQENDVSDLSLASQKEQKPSKSFLGKALALGMMTTALAGCFTGGPADATITQQMTDPAVAEMVQPANPFELMRMDDGSVAISADLANDDAYVLANGAAIRQDGGSGIALRTQEGTSLCEQAEALGGSCLNDEQVIVSDPSGPLMIETFARDGEPIHRLEAKAADGVSNGGVELNKLPAGTEVFSDNGSGLLKHNGDLQLYPNF